MLQGDDFIAVVLALATALAMIVLVEAGAGDGPPSTPAAFRLEPTCSEWSDGCVVCQRTAQGPSCSTPGIACVRSEPRCLRRDGA